MASSSGGPRKTDSSSYPAESSAPSEGADRKRCHSSGGAGSASSPAKVPRIKVEGSPEPEAMDLHVSRVSSPVPEETQSEPAQDMHVDEHTGGYGHNR